MKSFGYFDHDADIGIIGRGGSLEEAFVAAAEAVFAVMAEKPPERPEIRIAFDFEEEDVEFALIRWLNILIAYAQSRSLMLGRFGLRRDGAQWHAEAWGEAWAPGTARGVEVKGATLTMLRVEEQAGGWEARCIVDV